MPRNMDEFLKSVKTTFEKYTKMTSIYPNKIRVKELNYAWGSCTSKKNITINSKLAIRTKEELEYVVLHELCHIKHMNHSKEFWKLVESYMPEYKQVKKKLKE